MPIYATKCRKGHLGEVYAKVEDRLHLRCPECKGKAAIDFTRITVTDANTQFSGDKGVARSESYPKRSVARARELIGNGYANCIKSDGRVVFRDSKEAQGYYKRRREVQKLNRSRKGKDPEFVPED